MLSHVCWTDLIKLILAFLLVQIPLLKGELDIILGLLAELQVWPADRTAGLCYCLVDILCLGKFHIGYIVQESVHHLHHGILISALHQQDLSTA